MAKLSSDIVGRAFVERYYTILHMKPEASHGFYENASLATWDMKDCVTTQEGIHDMILSSDFKDCIFLIDDIRTQNSVHGTILVVVSGVATGKEKSRKFIQTFVLAGQEITFYVLNDILYFVDEEDIREVPSQVVFNSEPAVKEPTVVDVDNVSDVSQVSDDAKVLEPTIGETAVEPEPKVPVVEAPANTDQKVSEVVVKEVEKAAAAVPEVAPTVPVSVPEVKDVNGTVSEAPKEDAPKLSYLEMVSKGKTSSSPIPSTNIVRVSALAFLPEEEKAKIRALQNGLRRAMTSASETKPETPSPKNSVRENNNIGPKGIYIGGLLPETSVEDLASAVKGFGRVNKFADSVKVIRAADGSYSFGFVHFQFAESAKKAVEAKVITVLGKEARISYKSSAKRASNGGNENRGRSPTGRGNGSHSRTPSSRAPSTYSCDSPRHARQNGQSNRSQNGDVNSHPANNNGKTRHVSSQQADNGRARHVSTHQADNGNMHHVSTDNGKTRHISSQQENNGRMAAPEVDEDGFTIYQKRRQKSHIDRNNSQRGVDQRSSNGNAGHHRRQGNGRSDGRMHDGERNEPRRQNGGGGPHNDQKPRTR
ncbi:hypothetical protein DM860_000290 [Cuscuta australis]|uniref:NTF2 domain-containing protein n=1 Tax=Cuscuta australis TaxID=267555 RepID=A0A328CWX4_9ASTE|nr:hypothetical protein DM860_000290 [Cuscuta australis]